MTKYAVNEMRKRYSYYEFETFYETLPHHNLQGWGYKIFNDDPDFKFWTGTDLFRESDELFDSELQAEFAAIGHISLLENGEG